MAGLEPAIHLCAAQGRGIRTLPLRMDGPVKPGHDKLG
jgi:hypothetical protein